ncbi:MAG: ABC transporter ATP-binding protein [Anaerolineales bacterium]|nr:ABC transporter ATP-binding protein [Anaerolineales bacterium]
MSQSVALDDEQVTQDRQSGAAQTPVLELHDLYKSYHTPAGDIPALKGINLQLGQGEFVALIGKSGAGKSTLVNVATGIDHPDQGEVFVNGKPFHLLDEDQRARWRGLNMGVVFQFFQLLPSISLIKNVTMPMEFCNRYTQKERTQRALHLLEQVGLADHAHKKPAHISGGQQQRVAIARALANDPSILVADEPTGNLDSRTAAEIMDLFSDLGQLGKTLLIVTHDKSIAHRADRVIEIVDGEINGS